MSAAENREIVTRYFEAIFQFIDSDDATAFRAMVHPDVRFWLPQSLGDRHGVDVPLVGIEALLSLVTLARVRYTTVTRVPQFVVADDNGVAAWIHISTPRRDGSGDYTNNYAFFWRVEDGRIVEIFEQPDSARSLDAFGRA